MNRVQGNNGNQPPVWLEVTVALLVPAACVGFVRVFEDPTAVIPIAGAGLLSSALAVLNRRIGIPLLASGLISAAVLVMLILGRYASETTMFGVIPTGASLEAVSALLDGLVANFRELQSPVPALPPFVAASIVASWIMGFLTDWGAMRLRLAFEPVLPAGLIFLFTSVPPISAGVNQTLPTVVFGLAVAAWAVSQRTAHLFQRGIWLTGHEQKGPATIATLGAILATTAVLAGGVLGPRLPGADAEPVYSFKDEVQPARKVISPYVNIKNRLVSQTNQELFEVTADSRSYWRIAGLDTYGGARGNDNYIWLVAGDFAPESGDLDSQDLPGPIDNGEQRLVSPDEFAGQFTENRQDYSVGALDAIWLPAAYEPAEILDSTAEVTWNAFSSSLTVERAVETSDGAEYSIVSRVPDFDPEQLQLSPDGPAFSQDELRSIPEEANSPDFDPVRFFYRRHLILPSDLTPAVADLANQVTAGASTRYEQALAIQEHFRTYDYEVSLSPREGDPIEQFLREREGFCQQFAGTYALMARSIGIPARVATGFTWGDPVAVDPVTGRTTFKVTGRHTHAWPELFFEGVGWVAFEPTPGRGLPGASSYTRQPAAQDSQVEQTPEPTPPPTTAPAPDTPPTTLVPEATVPPEPVDAPANGFSFDVPWRYVLPLLIVIAYLVGAPLIHAWRRRSRIAKAINPSEQIEAAWGNATDDLEIGLGLYQAPFETRREYALRAGFDSRLPEQALSELAELSTKAQFHPSALPADQVAEASRYGQDIRAAVKDSVPSYLLYLRQIEPRRLFSVLTGRPFSRPTNTTSPNVNLDQPDPLVLDTERRTNSSANSNGIGTNGNANGANSAPLTEPSDNHQLESLN